MRNVIFYTLYLVAVFTLISATYYFLDITQPYLVGTAYE